VVQGASANLGRGRDVFDLDLVVVALAEQREAGVDDPVRARLLRACEVGVALVIAGDYTKNTVLVTALQEADSCRLRPIALHDHLVRHARGRQAMPSTRVLGSIDVDACAQVQEPVQGPGATIAAAATGHGCPACVSDE